MICDEDDHDDHMEAMDEDDHDEDHDDHGYAEGLIAAYMQQNVELNGYELQVGRVFNLDSGDLEVSFSRDVRNGEFADE